MSLEFIGSMFRSNQSDACQSAGAQSQKEFRLAHQQTNRCRRRPAGRGGRGRRLRQLVVGRLLRGAGGKINLVAYSTPQKAYAKLIPAFQATTAGTGATLGQSLRAVRHPGDRS